MLFGAEPVAGQEGEDSYCCFEYTLDVIDQVPDDETSSSPDDETSSSPTDPGSDSGYENLGGMAPDASPSPEDVDRTLTATTGWQIVETDDACANNFDLNDRLGTDYGGPNTIRRNHKGVDIQGDLDNDILAWKGGNLSPIEDFDGKSAELTGTPCGHGVTVNHTDGSWTTYCHLNTLPRTSGWISAGAVVGQVGSTGSASGPHVHVTHHLAGDKENNYAEYFDYTSDRPADSQLNEGGC